MTHPNPDADNTPTQGGHTGAPAVGGATSLTDPSPSQGGGRGRKAGRVLLAISGLLGVALAGGLAAGTLLRNEREGNAKATDAAAAPPRVTVAVARCSGPTAERVLPGSALPLLEAGLFPRATGYIKTRLVDIGDRVKA